MIESDILKKERKRVVSVKYNIQIGLRLSEQLLQLLIELGKDLERINVIFVILGILDTSIKSHIKGSVSMAIDLQSPSIPTMLTENYYSQQMDPFTRAHRDELNAVIPYPPTVPIAFNAYIRYDGSGVGDENYNVGYKQQPVPSGIISSWTAGRYESPDLPVTHLPFAYAFTESTFPRYQSTNQPVYRNLRAPGINEGV